MSEQLIVPNTTDRASRYAALFPQMRSLLAGEADPIAAMANFSAAVQQVFQWHWAGFYRVVGGQLVLGPFQGPVACTPIGHGMGVCGTAWAENRMINVPDVDAFRGHIACSAVSRSEIVLPVRDPRGEVAAVFDVDSATQNDFTAVDELELAKLCSLIEPLIP